MKKAVLALHREFGLGAAEASHAESGLRAMMDASPRNPRTRAAVAVQRCILPSVWRLVRHSRTSLSSARVVVAR